MCIPCFFICAGSSYLDVDAYACCVSYTELLRVKGKKAMAFSTATPNYSVPYSFVEMFQTYFTSIDMVKRHENRKFIIVDVSDPDYFEPGILTEQIYSIFDHHTGYEKLWENKLGRDAHIDFIGAASTLIFEEWLRDEMLPKLSNEIAKLMIAGILDNTLNLTANVTTQRDIDAKVALCKIAQVDDAWCESYFRECQKNIEANLHSAISKDIKTLDGIKQLPPSVGQVAIWDARDLLSKKHMMYRVMENMSDSWLLNIISIQEGRSYFLCNNSHYRDALESFLNIKFVNDVAISPRMWLRKELIKATQ